METKSAPKKRVYRRRAPAKRVTGHGDYKTILSKLSSIAKSVAGEAKGPMGKAGEVVGKHFGLESLGRIAGNLIGKLTGTGAYINNADKIRYNTLFNKSEDGVQVPSFGNAERSTRLQHREYIGDLIAGPTGSPTLFNTWQNLFVNPALLDSFAWLSQIAENFDTYRFHGLVFEYKAMSGSATGTNTQLGNVIFSAQYNAANPPFTNKLQMENYQGACSCNPSENMLFGIECDPKDLPIHHLYTRSGQVPGTQSQQLYDLCALQIATQGVPTESQILGEIWVTYDVELYQPKLYAGQVGNGILSAAFHSETGTVQLGTANTAFLGMTPNAGNTLGVTLGYDSSGNGVITLDDSLVTGNYILSFTLAGTSASCVRPSSVLANAEPLNLFGTPATPLAQISTPNGAQTLWLWQYAFSIVNDNAQPVTLTILYSGAQTPTAPTVANIMITQVTGLIQPLG